MKRLKHLLLMSIILTLSFLSGSRVMSQKLTKEELEEQTIPVKVKTLLQLKGETAKKDSLISIAEQRFASYERYVSSLQGTIDVQQKSISTYENNAQNYTALYQHTFDYNKDLVKENKRLKTRVKIFKGLSIGLPAAALGAFIYSKI